MTTEELEELRSLKPGATAIVAAAGLEEMRALLRKLGPRFGGTLDHTTGEIRIWRQKQ